MAIASKGLWLIGENTGKAEGEETAAVWGQRHLVKQNSYSSVLLNDTDQDPITLLPGSANWSLMRSGDLSGPQSRASQVRFGPLQCTLEATYVPIAGLVDNFYGGNNLQNRVNFKFFGLRNISSAGGESEEHHWFTVSGTNGHITSLSYSLGESGDMFSLTLSATVYRWQEWTSGGDLVGEVLASHFDETGETCSSSQSV